MITAFRESTSFPRFTATRLLAQVRRIVERFDYYQRLKASFNEIEGFDSYLHNIEPDTKREELACSSIYDTKI